MTRRTFFTMRRTFCTVAFAASASACSHADFDPAPIATGATPTSSASAGTSPTPTASATIAPTATCGTPAPGAVFIAMGSYIEPASPASTYGTVYGYSLVDSGGNYPLQSSPIVLRPGDTVQFTNVDPPTSSGENGISHSAAGLQSSAFPPTPHAFPTGAFVATAATFSDSTIWSTGEVPSESSSLCYSQSFVVPASGTYYFGDLDFYNSVNMRDVIVVSSSAQQ